MKIINLTQHPATAEQAEAGVFDLTGETLATLKRLLTFTCVPLPEEVSARAYEIADMAEDLDASAAMLGGAIYLMPKLVNELRSRGIKPLAAFTQRISTESVGPEGHVVKTSVFKHAGFVEM